jgi:hypothetical protein
MNHDNSERTAGAWLFVVREKAAADYIARSWKRTLPPTTGNALKWDSVTDTYGI